MTIYLTSQTEALARNAIHRREVAATVREAQSIVNHAARAHRANAPRAGDAAYEPAEETMASIQSSRAKLVWAFLRWRNGVTW